MRPPTDRPIETVEVEVRYAETDQMGVVHHAVYPVWFELARTRLCESSGHHYSEIERLGFFLMVTALETDFRASARYGDTVSVDCWVSRLSSRGLTFEYRVRRGERALARGRTRHIWLRREDNRPCRTPEPLAVAFSRLAGRDPDADSG